MDRIRYMRTAMEKDAGLGSLAFKMLSKSPRPLGAARKVRGMGRGISNFAKHPIRETGKSMIAKPGTRMQNTGSEVGYAAKWGAGFTGAGILATPIFTSRDV